MGFFVYSDMVDKMLEIDVSSVTTIVGTVLLV
jgi:hypothetical protein